MIDARLHVTLPLRGNAAAVPNGRLCHDTCNNCFVERAKSKAGTWPVRALGSRHPHRWGTGHPPTSPYSGFRLVQASESRAGARGSPRAYASGTGPYILGGGRRYSARSLVAFCATGDRPARHDATVILRIDSPRALAPLSLRNRRGGAMMVSYGWVGVAALSLVVLWYEFDTLFALLKH
jgi:hypothetical protein